MGRTVLNNHSSLTLFYTFPILPPDISSYNDKSSKFVDFFYLFILYFLRTTITKGLFYHESHPYHLPHPAFKNRISIFWNFHANRQNHFLCPPPQKTVWIIFLFYQGQPACKECCICSFPSQFSVNAAALYCLICGVRDFFQTSGML